MRSLFARSEEPVDALGRRGQGGPPGLGEGLRLEGRHDLRGKRRGIRLAPHLRLHQPHGRGVGLAGQAHTRVGHGTGRRRGAVVVRVGVRVLVLVLVGHAPILAPGRCVTCQQQNCLTV